MKNTWTSHTADEQVKKDVKSSFLSSTVVRKRLKEICNDKIESSYPTDRQQYDNPNWAYMQADNAGYRRALKEIISLLEN
jgi:hypothetical protein